VDASPVASGVAIVESLKLTLSIPMMYKKMQKSLKNFNRAVGRD
jgi:hypothetical protein